MEFPAIDGLYVMDARIVKSSDGYYWRVDLCDATVRTGPAFPTRKEAERDLMDKAGCVPCN